MAVIFSQDWDVFPGREDEYEEFIMEYVPRSAKLGLQPVGGFCVEVGFGPRLVFLSSVESIKSLCDVMAEKEYKDLLLELKKFVINYQTKVLEPAGRVKKETYELQKGVWKYNQYYDLIPGKKREYADFIINEHLPMLEKFDYVDVTGGWYVTMGGFSEIVAEFTVKSPVDIGRILDNEEYRKSTIKMRRNYVVNYKSRIMRTTGRFEEPRWYRL